MKSKDLAKILMKNPDHDVRIILKADWYHEVQVETVEPGFNNNLVVNVSLTDDDIQLKSVKTPT